MLLPAIKKGFCAHRGELTAGFDAPGLLSVVFEEHTSNSQCCQLSPGVFRDRVWIDKLTEWLKTHNKTAVWERTFSGKNKSQRALVIKFEPSSYSLCSFSHFDWVRKIDLHNHPTCSSFWNFICTGISHGIARQMQLSRNNYYLHRFLKYISCLIT